MADSHPLKTYRETHEPPLRQEDLAQMLGVGKSTVSRWEDGKRSLEGEMLEKVSNVTGISVAALRPDLAKLFAEAAQ